MKKGLLSNLLFVLYATFSSDLLFWIVVDNLFLSTVKGMSEFNIILITMLGLLFTLVLYPFANLFIKKVNNRVSNITGSIFYIVAIVMFAFCDSLLGFIIAQIIYSSSSLFKQTASMILKNNLISQGKQDEFVKWKSYGRLGYSIITAIIASVAGICFNVNPYLPMYLSIGGAVISLILSVLYTEPKQEKSEQQPVQKTSIKSLLTNEMMILIFFMNLITVGGYVFLQGKTTMLLQSVCEDANFDVAKISIIISVVVLISRIIRIIANFVLPSIYKNVKNKNRILLGISILLFVSGICFALGGNLVTNIYINISLIGLGLFIVIAIRDMYATIENRMIINEISPNQQKNALVLANFYGKIGRLLINAFALAVLGIFSLNIMYIFMLAVTTGQIFICVPLSKYLKNETK